MNRRPRTSLRRAPASSTRPALAVLVTSGLALAALTRSAGALALPHPSGGWQEWLGQVGAVSAALSLLRPLALAVAAYLVLVSGLALAAAALRWRGGLHLARAVAAGPLKDLVPRAAAVAATVAGVAVLGAGPVGARTVPRSVAAVVAGSAVPSAPARRAQAPGAGGGDSSEPVTTAAPPTTAGDERLVRLPDEPGDPSATTGPSGRSSLPPTPAADARGPADPSAADADDEPGRATLALEDDSSPPPTDSTGDRAPAHRPRPDAPPARPVRVPEARPARPVRVPEPPAPASAGGGRDGAGAAPSTWTVQPGDHLWGMAASVLTRSTGKAPADADVIPYWRSLIEANRDRLVDPADPDLIFPGQVLVLPPVRG